MTETEKNHRIRWLLLAPSVLGASALSLACGLMMVGVLTLLIDGFDVFAFVLPATTAAVWVGTAYYIAPSHHIAVIWKAYITGNLFLLIVFPFPLIWIVAAIGGIYSCVYYIDKHRKSEIIETEIKRKTQ